MKKVIILLLIFLAIGTAIAQENVDVIEASKIPAGPTLRVVYKDSSGAIKDAGLWIRIEYFQQEREVNQKFGEYIKGTSLTGLSLIEPAIYKALTDSNLVLVPKSALVPNKEVPKKKKK